MHRLDTPDHVFGRRMVTVTELTRAYFSEHRQQTDVVVFNLNPVAAGRLNWSDGPGAHVFHSWYVGRVFFMLPHVSSFMLFFAS
jgi:hypothetical protein